MALHAWLALGGPAAQAAPAGPGADTGSSSSSSSVATPATAPAAADELTAAQRQWLASRQPVRFGPERDYGPFVFVRPDGQLDGLSVDMLRLVQARTGLVVAQQPAAPLRELLAAARNRQIDLISSLRPTPERAQFLRFSQPYVAVPAVLVRRATDAVRPLAELAGVPVALGEGYAVESVMRQRYRQVRWVALADDAVALAALQRGEVQAVVADVASVAFISRTQRMGGLRVDGPVGFEYQLSFAVRADWPELVDIINRGIRRVGPRERQRVLDQWLTPLAVDDGEPPAAVLWGLALLALALLAAAGLWLKRRATRPGRSAGA
ncbi:transporter substrate-binding domain-containing protein [Aquabacterium sp. OR-4]|uniref:transporter substrate-binding domain-containing protein n=1 Tax=Aquabacterium sp. OR-4 TaxID=2978127 RepID=UPI0021B3E112|nr:transporter substrate-binding domain-containing protein [Aquabacterium sp. OR-4]MDT7834601.1 transporter substrate-binding domain-containing protein [Aquabacterium sp. OR-4]